MKHVQNVSHDKQQLTKKEELVQRNLVSNGRSEDTKHPQADPAGRQDGWKAFMLPFGVMRTSQMT
jgi:hypothetical protein